MSRQIVRREPLIAPAREQPALTGAVSSWTAGRVFEGLFVRALGVDGEVAAALREIGYDPAEPRAAYPTLVFQAAMDVAWRARWPRWSRAAAAWELGRELTRGFLETNVGRVIALSLPQFGPDATIRRLPRYVAFGRDDIDMQVSPREEGGWIIRVHDPPARGPEFIAGCFEAAILRTGVSPRIRPDQLAPGRFVLAIDW